MHVERLLWSIYVPCLVLIDHVIFLLQRGQTVTQCPTHASGYTASEGNESKSGNLKKSKIKQRIN